MDGASSWLSDNNSEQPGLMKVQPDQRLLGFGAPACKVAFLATPYVRPPMMPDTWVPWPKQSSESPSPKLEKPALAREPADATKLPIAMTSWCCESCCMHYKYVLRCDRE